MTAVPGDRRHLHVAAELQDDPTTQHTVPDILNVPLDGVLTTAGNSVSARHFDDIHLFRLEGGIALRVDDREGRRALLGGRAPGVVDIGPPVSQLALPALSLFFGVNSERRAGGSPESISPLRSRSAQTCRSATRWRRTPAISHRQGSTIGRSLPRSALWAGLAYYRLSVQGNAPSSHRRAIPRTS